jgi:SpoVK/Ycf46/Vps4 family AAA+-type ATPase
MFHSRYVLHEVIYLPVIECTYHYYGKDESEFKLVSAIKGVHREKAYTNPYTPAPLMLGTAGYCLNSTPIESAAINFSAIAGMEEVKEELRKAIIYHLTRPELSKEFRQKAGGGILFYGPPGCGKTYIMQATVGEAGVNLYTAEIQDILGESPEAAAKRLHEIFQEARFNTPSVLFFDEIDALGGRRGQQSPEMRFVVNQFLADMSGLESSNENVLVVGATNAPWDVDPALRRAGRFTTKVFIPPPDFNTRVSLFKMYAQKTPLAGDINYERLAELTENFSSSDIAGICDKAAQIPWSDSIKGMQKRAVAMGDFTTVLTGWPSSLVPWYGLAERELSASGETDVYPELKMLIEKYRNRRQ